MRIIELNVEMPVGVPPAKLFYAIGYLSTWNPTFPKVLIYKDNKSPNLMAHYFKEDGDCGYTIGAVWNGEDYSFHS